MVRGLTDGNEAVAFANAERVIDLEKGIGTFFEPGFQDALLSHTWLIDFANFAYMNSHFVVTTTFLVWLYLFRNDHFYFVRNMFMVAMVVALAGYAAFPTAPPRLIPEAGASPTRSPSSPACRRTRRRSACWSTSTRRCRACTSPSR